MNKVLRTAILSTAVAAMTFAALPAANARDWNRHHGHRGDAIAAGVVGLAAGALIGSALASQPPPPPRYYYDDPIGYDDGYYERPAYVVRRAPVRVVREYDLGGVEPWSREWYDYCSSRYRSFNARTGTFTGYDGQQHFCNAN